MSIFAKSGGGGITPEQLEALVSDTDLATQLSTLATASQAAYYQSVLLAKLDAAAAAGAVAGEVRLFNNTTGVVPGWSTTGQNIPTAALWASSRLLALPYRPAASTVAPASSSLGSYLTAISEQHNKLFVFGGIFSGARKIGMWDLGTFAWTQSAQHPSTLQLGAMAKAGGYVYTGGGNSASSTTSAMYRYNIATDSFTNLARPASAGRDWALLPLPDGRVIAAGGCTSSTATATNLQASAQLYDPVANGWTTLTAAPLSFCSVRSAALGNGKFLLRPDYTSDGTTLNTANPPLLMFDYPALAWTIVEALPAGYSSPQAVSATPDGRGVVFCATSPTGLSCALLYDPAAAVGSRFTPYDVGDTDTMKFGITSGVASGTCMRDYAGCIYMPAYTLTANVTSPTLIRFGADVPVMRNFYAVKNP